MKILIADDNASLRKLLRQLLEAHKGWTVCSEAQDGLEAIEQAKQCRPDLVLLDLAMPNVNGLIAARRISELLPGTPIVIFTLFATPQLQSEAKSHGVMQVISKSDGHSLIPAIEALLQTTRTSETKDPKASPPLKSTTPQLA